MRNHRFALVITAFAVPLTVLSITGTLNGSAANKEKSSWKSSALAEYQVPPAQQDKTPMTGPQSKTLISQMTFQRETFYHALVAQETEALTYLAAKNRQSAQEQYASRTSTGSTSHDSITTPVPAASGDNSTIWACIVRHESGGNPTAVNPSSGDNGLYQFNNGTWLSNGGGQYAPQADEATPAEQTAIAQQTQASDGWSPWVGDGCTPLG